MSTQPHPQPFIPVGDLHPAAWHQERAQGVGGSECASLFNEGYGCANRLIREKRGQEPDYRRTEAEEKILRRGLRLEDIVAGEFAAETKLKIRKQPSRVSKTHPHARVNMDRQIVSVDGRQLYELTADEHGHTMLDAVLHQPGPGALECKTMNPFDFRKVAKEGLVKHNHYILQLQHTLAVTGYKWGVFAILDTTSFELLWFPMVRNEALCEAILARVEAAWEVVEDLTLPLPPPLPDGDKRCVKCLYRKSCRGEEYLTKYADADFSTDYTDNADPELVQWASDLDEAEAQADQADVIVKSIKGLIRARMEELKVTKLRVPEIRRFCLSTSAGRRTWDGKAIEGEIHSLRKGELPRLPVEPAEIEASAPVIAALLPVLADRIANCQKQGAPSTSFRAFNA